MATKRERRERDPEATRAAILAAARTLLARDGPEGLSVVQVAQLAGVNRRTAYQYFPDRDRLLHATVASVSEGLIDAIWSPSDVLPTGQRFTDKSMAGSAGRLAAFTVQNASFCRVWLFDLLSSDDPGSDPFSRVWFASVRAFCESDGAVPGIDADVCAAFMLTAYLCWPIWMRTDKLKPQAQLAARQRLVTELLRMSMYGALRADHFPTVRRILARENPKTAERKLTKMTETRTEAKKKRSKRR